MESERSEEQSGRDYQVFLSFRGPDTRQGFTDCLYHFLTNEGIRVFRDDEEQRLGEPITKIRDAVNKSIIGIPIFSTNFATSKWCLREIAKMVELDKVVIPIFYDVTPDDVKLEEGSPYIGQLRKIAAVGVESSEVKKWEEALKKIGGFTGRTLKKTGFGEFSMSIVKEVLVKLKVKDKTVTDKLVGMDGRIKAVIQLLHMESDEVRFVGIHGIGGSGKTTLAEVVFNRIKAQFDPEHVVFLSNARESSKDGLKYLQEQFLNNLGRQKTGDISDIDQGKRKIEDLLCGKKVFMVLDDVNHMDHIDMVIPRDCRSLDPGSRIIITTRNNRILTTIRERSVNVGDFEMKEMEDSEALQLFSKHAFKEAHPPAGYLQLANQALSAVGKLPLSLVVIGSYLCRTHQEEWEDKMRMLKKIPHKDVQKKLMISYESLEFRTKQIFLDIACLFSGEEKTYAIYMWEACNLHPESGLEELTAKSLIKITDQNEFWMHSQLKDLGREIVCLENVTDLGERSRLWLPEEALRMLRRREGTKIVEALCLSYRDEDNDIASEEFTSLRNLRFLECPMWTFVGDFQHMLSKLTWLSWKYCPFDFKATNLNLQSLVILDLTESDIDENWGGWTCMKIGDTLKVLNLSYCRNLRRTPDLSNYRRLEKLILNDCDGLVEIDSSIGKLRKLKYLVMDGFSSLQAFPEELCLCDSLEEIILHKSGDEVTLRKSFALPESIGNLTSLKVVEFYCVEIDRIPESIGELVMLRKLFIYHCRSLKKLPRSLGKLKSLTELDLNGTAVRQLPHSIGKLQELDVLSIAGTKIKWLPTTIGELQKLKELSARNSHIEHIPRDIERLPHLERLDFSRTRVRKLPSLSKLSTLKELNLDGCKRLSEMPELPTSLMTLYAEFESLHRIPDLSHLDSLITLCLATGMVWQSTSLEWIGKLTKLVKLSLDLGSNGSSTETKLPNLSHLINLRSLELRHFSVEDGGRNLGIAESDSLEVVRIRNCYIEELNFHPGKDTLVTTEEPKLSLSISVCNSLERIDNLLNIRSLYISSCSSLEGLDHLPMTLTNLWIISCQSLPELPDLSPLRNLCELRLERCGLIAEIPGLGELESLEKLNIAECSSLTRLESLSKLVCLRSLSIRDCENLKVVQGIHKHNMKFCDLQLGGS